MTSTYHTVCIQCAFAINMQLVYFKIVLCVSCKKITVTPYDNHPCQPSDWIKLYVHYNHWTYFKTKTNQFVYYNGAQKENY